MKADDCGGLACGDLGDERGAAGGGGGGARRGWSGGFGEEGWSARSPRGRAGNGGRRARRGLRAVPIARAARSSVGAARTGCCGSAARAAGDTFNALTKTPMAHLRKKEKWLDHARAMIEGKSLAKTAALCGVHPTTAFRWRHWFLRAPPSTSREPCVGSWRRTKPLFSSLFKGRWSDLSREPRKRGGTGQARRDFIRTPFPFSSPATGRARPSMRSCPRSTALR